jgi:hypothetical protein
MSWPPCALAAAAHDVHSKYKWDKFGNGLYFNVSPTPRARPGQAQHTLAHVVLTPARGVRTTRLPKKRNREHGGRLPTSEHGARSSLAAASLCAALNSFGTMVRLGYTWFCPVSCLPRSFLSCRVLLSNVPGLPTRHSIVLIDRLAKCDLTPTRSCVTPRMHYVHLL